MFFVFEYQQCLFITFLSYNEILYNDVKKFSKKRTFDQVKRIFIWKKLFPS